jgi:trk system potassium uptake protein TrkA
MQILIIGAGDIGFQLAKQLSQEKHDITMIEADPQKVRRASEQLDAIVLGGNGASYRLLQTANLERMEIVAAMTDSDEANLMACRLAKRSGVNTTIARVRHPQFTQHDFILSPEDLETDLILHPERETADAIVHLIRRSAASYAVEFEGGRIELLGVRLTQDSPYLNVPLSSLGQQNGLPMRIIAINRNYETVIPKGHDALAPGDQVFVICDHDSSAEVIGLAGKKPSQLKNVMILGGGLIGQFAASNLEDEANVKIIESNIDTARKLADILPQTLIIHGDGTDLDILENEGLADMDAFVAVTGHDEGNIITTLLAQHSNVPRAIALVNNAAYLSIVGKIGMDAVVSKQSLTVNTVQRYIRRQQVASIAGLPGIDAEVIEYIASEGCKITHKELKDLRFPRNAIVGAVLRQDELIIPHGDTQIMPGDKVIVFALPQALNELERLFDQEQSRSRLSQFLHV